MNVNSYSTTDSGIDTAKSSYWKNSGGEPLKNLTVGRLIDESFRKYENRIAIKVHQGSRLTFGQAYERVSVMPSNGGSGLIKIRL